MAKHASGYIEGRSVRNHYSSNVTQRAEANSITYTEPEEEFVDGHPLGNGDLGIMVTGSPSRFRFHFAKSDVWDYRTVRDGGSAFPEVSYEELIRIAEEGDRERYQTLNKQALIDYSRTHYPSPQSCGLLEIGFGNDAYRSYHQVLNLYTGEEEICWQTEHGSYRVGCVLSQEQNVSELAIDFFDVDRNAIEIFLHRTPTDLYEPEEHFVEGGYTGFEFTYPDGLRYVNLMCVDSGDDVNVCVPRAEIQRSTSGKIRIAQTIVTSLETDEPRKLARERLDQYLKLGSGRAKEESARYWANFWRRSYIDLHSKDAEKMWYVGLYLIGSCSRPGTPSMPGLQGVWLEDYSPAWKGSYTTDLNVEMNYWPVYASNHLDIAEPFYRCYKDLIPKFQKDTREYFGMQGIRIPICHDNRGNDGAGYLGGLYWQGASAWIASHFWKNYLFSHDESFLRDCAYPFMVECVRYYNSVLRKSGGRYIVYKSWTPEEMESDQIKAVDDNPAIDLSLIRGLYGAFVQTVDILGVQPEMDMELVRDIHGNLADYSREAGHIADSENCDFDYCHRHLSVATPIYPSGELNAYSSSEEDYRLGLSTFYKHIGRANGERRVYFSGTYTWLACVAATLGLKDFANVYLSDYLDSFVNQKNLLNMTFDFGRTGRGVNVDDTQTFSAGTEYEFAERVIQLESNTCAAEAVNLMLLQSFGDGISILPAYPWREAVFEGLRAQGGFLVSARLREWRLESVFVESLEGRICTLYLDSDVRRVEVQDIADGETRSIPELAANDIGNRMRFSFDTEPGCEYEITVAY